MLPDVGIWCNRYSIQLTATGAYTFLSYSWRRRRRRKKRKPGVSKHGYFSVVYVCLPVRPVYSKNILYSALHSRLSPVFCIFWNFAPISMYRENKTPVPSLLIIYTDEWTHLSNTRATNALHIRASVCMHNAVTHHNPCTHVQVCLCLKLCTSFNEKSDDLVMAHLCCHVKRGPLYIKQFRWCIQYMGRLYTCYQ